MIPKSRIRIVFMGTPDFAVPSLQALLEEEYNVVGVFTQPDKPVGRKQVLQPPPIKTLALSHGLEVVQLPKIKSEQGLNALSAMKPDLIVTAAFGQILSRENLEIPSMGCINVHGSLLPLYRGAAPIQWALIEGQAFTGVTTMFTDVGIDTGDMLIKKRLEIMPDETAGELFIRVANLGARTLIETIEKLRSGELERIPQDESHATYCKILKKEDAKIDWTASAQDIHNLVRGTNPWPGAFCQFEGKTIKIWRTRLSDRAPQSAQPGEVLNIDSELIVATKSGAIEILELQPSGGKRMDASSFLRGHSITQGSVLN